MNEACKETNNLSVCVIFSRSDFSSLDPGMRSKVQACLAWKGSSVVDKKCMIDTLRVLAEPEYVRECTVSMHHN